MVQLYLWLKINFFLRAAVSDKKYVKAVILWAVLGNDKKKNEYKWLEFEKLCLLECIYWKELGYEDGGQDFNRKQGKFEEQF